MARSGRNLGFLPGAIVAPPARSRHEVFPVPRVY